MDCSMEQREGALGRERWTVGVGAAAGVDETLRVCDVFFPSVLHNFLEVKHAEL
jgi:hypothetical protein